jgi:hypothetical protein
VVKLGALAIQHLIGGEVPNRAAVVSISVILETALSGGFRIEHRCILVPVHGPVVSVGKPAHMAQKLVEVAPSTWPRASACNPVTDTSFGIVDETIAFKPYGTVRMRIELVNLIRLEGEDELLASLEGAAGGQRS